MISLELLRDVLDVEIVDHTYMKKNKHIYYHEEGIMWARTISIYELAFMCKEWAKEKGHDLKLEEPSLAFAECEKILRGEDG